MSNTDERKKVIDVIKDDVIKDSTLLGKCPNSELGMSQKYDRKLYDSRKGKNTYKEKVFGDRNTYVDPISGEILHKSQTAAQNKYHMKNAEGKNISKAWAKHSAETDHINALNGVHKVAKHNPFLSDADFKEVMNSDSNYRILSKSANASKQDSSDWREIRELPKKAKNMSREQIRDLQVHMAKEKIGAGMNGHKQFAVKTVKNIGNEFISGAKESLANSVIPLTAIAVDQMCKVVKGEESFAEAVKESGKAVVDVAVISGTQKLVLDITNCVLKNSNTATQIVNVALLVKESAIKYVNGEIDGKQFLEKVGERGTVMVAGMVGGAVGKEIGALIGTVLLPGAGTIAGEVVGQILGTIITTVACSAISMFYSTVKSLDDYKLKEKEVKIIEREAIEEIERQRRKFKDIVEKEFQYWDEEIKGGFEKIFESATKEEFASEGVAEGLDRILKVFGKEVRFKTLEEYESQLDTTIVLEF